MSRLQHLRWKIMILGCVALAGVVQALMLKDMPLSNLALGLGLAVSTVCSALFIPVILWVMTKAAAFIMGPVAILPLSWKTNIWRQFRCGDVLHLIHFIGLMAIMFNLSTLVSVYLCYRSLCGLALLQLPPPIAVVASAVVLNRLLLAHRNPGTLTD